MKKIFYIIIGSVLPLGTYAQLQNLDFEQCNTSETPQIENTNCYYLEGWTRGGTSSNTFFSIQNGGITDAQNGNIALRLSVWYTYNKDFAFQKASFSSFPESIDGYYTYTDNIVGSRHEQIIHPDSAVVSVVISKWNNLIGKKDTIGFGRLQLDQALSYTKFSCPIQYISNTTPDSIQVTLDCSRVESDAVIGSMWGNSSIFTVDNLSIEGNALGTSKVPEIKKWKIYPNPGNGIIHIANFKGEIAVFDLKGKLLRVHSYPSSKVDVSFLPQGVYLLRLIEKLGQISYVKYIKQ